MNLYFVCLFLLAGGHKYWGRVRVVYPNTYSVIPQPRIPLVHDSFFNLDWTILLTPGSGNFLIKTILWLESIEGIFYSFFAVELWC